MDIKALYIVSFNGVDGEQYSMGVKVSHEYEANSICASIVNHGRNFGYNFKAKFKSFI